MPELPEVENCPTWLENWFLVKKISTIDIRYPKMIKTDLDEFRRELPGQVIQKMDVVASICFSIYPIKF